jgi:hypothetical protein
VQRRKATKVDSVDEMIFLPSQLLLVGVFVKILGINIAQNLASRKPVPSGFVEDRVAVLK